MITGHVFRRSMNGGAAYDACIYMNCRRPRSEHSALRMGPYGLPYGLCPDREEHRPHAHGEHGAGVGRFWCTARQSDREPWRSERRRSEAVDG